MSDVHPIHLPFILSVGSFFLLGYEHIDKRDELLKDKEIFYRTYKCYPLDQRYQQTHLHLIEINRRTKPCFFFFFARSFLLVIFSHVRM